MLAGHARNHEGRIAAALRERHDRRFIDLAVLGVFQVGGNIFVRGNVIIGDPFFPFGRPTFLARFSTP